MPIADSETARQRPFSFRLEPLSPLSLIERHRAWIGVARPSWFAERSPSAFRRRGSRPVEAVGLGFLWLRFGRMLDGRFSFRCLALSFSLSFVCLGFRGFCFLGRFYCRPPLSLPLGRGHRRRFWRVGRWCLFGQQFGADGRQLSRRRLCAAVLINEALVLDAAGLIARRDDLCGFEEWVRGRVAVQYSVGREQWTVRSRGERVTTDVETSEITLLSNSAGFFWVLYKGFPTFRHFRDIPRLE